jgi:hypothetical protein
MNKNQNDNVNSGATSEYMLLFRGTDWHRNLSPEQMQTVMTQWKAWFDRLTNQGKLKAGQPLMNEGTIVSGKKGRIDGPFAESKEAIGGYFLLQVSSFEDALAIARECPGLEHGVKVEVRPVASECPASQAARQANDQEQLARG